VEEMEGVPEVQRPPEVPPLLCTMGGSAPEDVMDSQICPSPLPGPPAWEEHEEVEAEAAPEKGRMTRPEERFNDRPSFS